MKNTETNNLEQENAELKAQVKALSTLNPALNAGGVDDSDEIDLKELWNAIWAGKWLIIGITFVFSVASIFYALSLSDIYRSEATLVASEEASGGGLSSIAQQFGGLASIAGINLGGGTNNKVKHALETLKSRVFVYEFIKSRNIKVDLMASRTWNRETKELVIDQEIFDTQQKTWVRAVGYPQKQEPSLFESYEYFVNNVLMISQDKQTSLIYLSVDHVSPVVAQKWTEWLIEDLNIYVKSLDILEARKSIQYLNNQLEGSNIAEMRKVFFQLIEEQTKKIMLAEVRKEYVLKTIDPAVIAERKNRPKRALIVILFSVLGGFIGCALVFLRKILSRP